MDPNSPPPPLPPACADVTSTFQPPQPGSPPQKISYKMSRASDGKMRMDYGPTSVITDPKSGKMLVLDHVKKEAKMLELPKGAAPTAPEPPKFQMPGAPPPPTKPDAPKMEVKDLGKRMIEGHEVEGKQYTMPAPPKPPAPPAIPQPPARPGMPVPPKPPEKPDPKPTVSEVWTSTKLQMPLLSRITGDFGQQMSHCKNIVPGEPPPATFQIPPDYKRPGMPKV